MQHLLRCNMRIPAMATFWHGATHEAVPSLSLRVRERFSHIQAWFGEHRARAQALRELQSMDERDLRAICARS